MRLLPLRMGALVLVALSATVLPGQDEDPSRQKSYVGFDRNEYPGETTLARLRKTFAFTGYWLNTPPGAHENTWVGKRVRLRQAGFGFLVLFNGRLDAELRKAANASEVGRKDAETAVDAARREGFPANTVIFLDQEEGGRMLPEQKAYLFAWVDGVNDAGFRAGIYCSGIAVSDERERVTTAEDIQRSAGGRNLRYWIANDACPPSPGCAIPISLPAAGESGTAFAQVWQYAQSPRRKDVAAGCPKNYASDGNCYAPGLEKEKLFVDLNVASRRDPSGGR
ncbi:MAG TPA: glycoside hydrolase domain-containing protein [Terriglobales bacterium]|nr:glycoside hydrolase domain-containing protein [Terriglobales bacterium]